MRLFTVIRIKQLEGVFVCFHRQKRVKKLNQKTTL
jgi:hypothetical protein